MYVGRASSLNDDAVVLQSALGREELAGCAVAGSLRGARLRCSDCASDGRRTKESHRSRLRQPAQVRRRHRHGHDDIPRQKVPLIDRMIDLAVCDLQTPIDYYRAL